jgi:hypothetical protein
MVLMLLPKLTRAIAKSNWDDVVTFAENISMWARKNMTEVPTVDKYAREYARAKGGR